MSAISLAKRRPPKPKPAPAPHPQAPVAAPAARAVPSLVLIDVDAGLPAASVIVAAAALHRQAQEHFGPAWNAPATVRASSLSAPQLAGEWRVEFHDMPPTTVQGALGFHDRQPDGTPILYVFAGLCAREGISWTSCASHEICEALADPYLRRCVQAPDGAIWALETCDACETVSYSIDGVEVSDFCMPAYFEPELDSADQLVAGQQFDWCKSVAVPFQILDGGYGQTFDPREGWVQHQAKHRHGAVGMRAHRKILSDLGLSRVRRRQQ